MPFDYYHQAVDVVADAIDQVINDRENTEDAYASLEDAEHQVQGWMVADFERASLLRLIQSTKVLIEENA